MGGGRMSYYTILIQHINLKGNVIWTSRSWTKKIYDDKQQAIDALIEMRKSYNLSLLRYKIVELRIINEFEI